MPQRPKSRRKRRTREHIIADLGIHFVAKQALMCGFSVEQPLHDYGVDLLVFTYSELGEPEPGEIRIQVKATDNLQSIRGGKAVTIRVERADVRSWILQPMPVILIVYDAAHERAFWLYIQAHFGGVRRFRTSGKSESMTLRIPAAQVLNPDAIRRFQQFRDALVNQMEDIRHDQ